VSLAEVLGTLVEYILSEARPKRRRGWKRQSVDLDKEFEDYLASLDRYASALAKSMPSLELEVVHPRPVEQRYEVEDKNIRVKVVARESVAPEAARLAAELAPKVAEKLGVKGEYTIEVSEGVVVQGNMESIAATNPDREPVKILVHPDFEKLPPHRKKMVIAHELAHVFGVRGEAEADRIAREVVGEENSGGGGCKTCRG